MKCWEILPLLIAFYYTIIFGQHHSSDLPDNWMMFLKNERFFQRYTNCIFDRGPCSNDGNKLKKILPDFFQNKCENCTEKEKEVADTVVNYIKENKPEVWDELVDKYTPKEEKSFWDILFGMFQD